MAAVILADMTAGEQGIRYIRRSPGRDIGDDPSVILVGTDMVDRDLTFLEQAAQGIAGSLGHSQFLRTGCLQLGRIDAAQANPGRQREPGRQMHPRLERIAIDRSDNVDGVPDIRISRASRSFRFPSPPVSRPGPANAPNAAAAALSLPPPQQRTPRARPLKTSRADGPDKYLFFCMGTYSQRKPATEQQG
jgi:hypothetical protein